MHLIPVCLLIAEITIFGFLLLKTARIASGLMIPLLIITLLWTVYIHQKHFTATNYLPGCDCVNTDRRNNINGPMDMGFLTDQYIQPELRDKELYPTNASLERQVHFGTIPTNSAGENAILGKGVERSSTMSMSTNSI